MSIKLSWSVTAALLTIGIASTQATAQNAKFTLKETGGNVVGTWSGSFDLTGLTLSTNGNGYDSIGNIAWDSNSGSEFWEFTTGNTSSLANTDVYVQPFTFNAGLSTGANQFFLFSTAAGADGTGVGTGDMASVYFGYGADMFIVPAGYTSGQTLNSSATWSGATLAGMGLVGGTSVWNYGSNGAKVTVQVVTPGGAVPEPGEWAAMGILGAGLTGLVIRKRKKA